MFQIFLDWVASKLPKNPPRFFLEETYTMYESLLGRAADLREQGALECSQHAEKLLREASLHRQRAQKLAADTSGNEVTRELRRRDVELFMERASSRRKHAVKFQEAAKRIVRNRFRVPGPFITREPPAMLSTTAWAEESARREEWNTIAQEGAQLYSDEGHRLPGSPLPRGRRRVVRYQGQHRPRPRLYLVKEKQIASERKPSWEVAWVTSSLQQMTREELEKATKAEM